MVPELLVVSSAVFDVDAATRAYLDTFQGAARAQSDSYVNSGYLISFVISIVFVLCDWLLLRLRIAAAFRTLAERLFRRPFAVAWLTSFLYIVTSWLITMPLSYYIEYWRDRQYGLTDKSAAGWFNEQVMLLMLMAALAPLFLATAYAIIRRSPRNWWIWASALTAPAMVAIMVLSPVFIKPLFNTYTEMQPGPLRTQIEAMAARYDIPSTHIYVFDRSRQDQRIAASVSGLGPTIRIALNDNLLNHTSDEEILAVMGHEVGHYVLDHVWWNLGVLFALFVGSFYLASRIVPAIIRRWGGQWGVRELADPASVPLISICMSMMLFVAMPLVNTVNRISERQADAFSLDVARQPDGLARIAMRFGEYRKTEPGPVEEFLLFAHPSAATRVRMAMEWKAKHENNPKIVVPPKGYLDHK